MVFKLPKEIKNDRKGLAPFVRLFQKSQNLEGSELTLDFSRTEWFEANLCAVLGAILFNVSEKLNKITFVSLRPSIRGILTKNSFLSFFGGTTTIPDKYKTTVKFSKFEVSKGKQFQEYLEKELLSRRVLPKMSKLLRNEINKSIIEIFTNAHIHGGCKYIFSSGQYYPRKRKLDFTIVDLGRSIRTNVNKYRQMELKGSDAIKWAVEEGNTTKTGNIPGGLGFSLIRDFLKLNSGKIQIISSEGYWQEVNDNIFAMDYIYRFDGTIVNLEFNIDDSKNYILSSEINPNSIF